MPDFERQYYESDAFWTGANIQDTHSKIRISTTAQMIPADASSLADIGCGNGAFGNFLQQAKPSLRVMSVDRSETALKYVKTEKTIGDIVQIPLPGKSFDCVTCLQVLEHIPVTNYQLAISELARVSSKYIIVSVPFNEKREKNTTQCPQCLSIFNSDLHLRSYTENDMSRLFTEFGFDMVEHKNIVKERTYVGIEMYSKLRKTLGKKQPPSFRSPICPICGFENKKYQTGFAEGNPAGNGAVATAKKISSPKDLIKQVWPKKEVPGYWVIALYKRK